MRASVVGRLAPSPTGALHLGNVRTFMIAWLSARAQKGHVILRMEDLDHPRDKKGAAAQAIADLRWLGFDWDESYTQSQRISIYAAALKELLHHQKVYPCVCSRSDVERAQSAPHAGEQLYYPGTCRGRFADWESACRALPEGRLPCWRFVVEKNAQVAFNDSFSGSYTADVSATLGDFPLARHPQGAGYTLASVVDDALMGVTEVVRGDDLLAATPAQILIQRALNLPQPTYCHVPLVVGPDGHRLAKRHGDTRIATYREAGLPPEAIIGALAASCDWCAAGERLSLKDLIPRFTLQTIPHHPFVIDETFLRP